MADLGKDCLSLQGRENNNMPSGIYTRKKGINCGVGINKSLFIRGQVGYWADKKRPSFSDTWLKNMSERRKGIVVSQATKDSIARGNMGKKRTEEHKRAIGNASLGEKSKSWKGNKVSHRGLLQYIRRWKGIPMQCEFCDKLKTTPKSIHWVCDSDTVSRNLDDWTALCASCHQKLVRGSLY